MPACRRLTAGDRRIIADLAAMQRAHQAWCAVAGRSDPGIGTLAMWAKCASSAAVGLSGVADWWDKIVARGADARAEALYQEEAQHAQD